MAVAAIVRVAIAVNLGVPYETIVRHFDTEEAKREHVLKLNLARRHLDPLRWGQAFARLLETYQKVSLDESGMPVGPIRLFYRRACCQSRHDASDEQRG